MFYQVTIKRKDSRAQEIEALNLSRESLERRLLGPYREGSSITLNGISIQSSDLDGIRIVETQAEVSNFGGMRRVSLDLGGFTYSHDERDVTNDFITGPPGDGSEQRQSDPPESQTWDSMFDLLVTDNSIREASRELYLDGHYSSSVEKAFVRLNNEVKDRSGLVQQDGAGLMKTAFSANSPKLKLNEFRSQSDRDEQQGYMDLFAGSMTGIRNPRAHEHGLIDQPEVALELLVLANHLMRKVQAATKSQP